jgi:hypothetical protein
MSLLRGFILSTRKSTLFLVYPQSHFPFTISIYMCTPLKYTRLLNISTNASSIFLRYHLIILLLLCRCYEVLLNLYEDQLYFFSTQSLSLLLTPTMSMYKSTPPTPKPIHKIIRNQECPFETLMDSSHNVNCNNGFSVCLHF